MPGLLSVRAIIGAGAIVALGTVLWLATRPPPLTVQGEVSADRVDISPRVGGRIAKLGPNVGDTVERGIDSRRRIALTYGLIGGSTDYKPLGRERFLPRPHSDIQGMQRQIQGSAAEVPRDTPGHSGDL
jgi:hypothetical protein